MQTLNNNSGSGDSSDSTNPSNQEEQLKHFLAESGKKSSNQAVKNLLENYGFELVMQFNEYHQRKKEEEERRRKAEELVAEANNANVTASTASTMASSEPQRPPSANTAPTDIFSAKLMVP